MLGVQEEIRIVVARAMAAQRDLDYREWQGSIREAEYVEEKAAAIAHAVNDLSWLVEGR